MEFMTNYQSQPEGIWIINEEANTAYRIQNGVKGIERPVTTEILSEIKKQIEAEKYFQLFEKLDIQDDKMIGYLNFMLDDYYNYLSLDNQKKFMSKMHIIPDSNFIDVQNAFYIQKLCANLEKKDIDSFYDSLEEFQEYNQPYFEKILTSQSEEVRHLS